MHRTTHSGTVLSLGASLQAGDVTRCKQELELVLDADQPVTVDVGSLAAVDTAGVQLLLALVQEGARRRLPVTLRGSSTVLRDALALLGAVPAQLAWVQG